MKKILITLALFAAAAALTLSIYAQQVKRTPFDVTNYVMDVNLSPTERKLAATADVTFTPLEDTRTVTFELNGSLKIDSILDKGTITSLTVPVYSSENLWRTGLKLSQLLRSTAVLPSSRFSVKSGGPSCWNSRKLGARATITLIKLFCIPLASFCAGPSSFKMCNCGNLQF